MTQGHNLEKPLTCQRCRMDFPGVVHLVNHIKNSNHEGAVLRCKFCVKFSFRVTGKFSINKLNENLLTFKEHCLYIKFEKLSKLAFNRARTFKCIGTPAVEAHLSAHWFSSEHLHNRFVRLFQKVLKLKLLESLQMFGQ